MFIYPLATQPFRSCQASLSIGEGNITKNYKLRLRSYLCCVNIIRPWSLYYCYNLDHTPAFIYYKYRLSQGSYSLNKSFNILPLEVFCNVFTQCQHNLSLATWAKSNSCLLWTPLVWNSQLLNNIHSGLKLLFNCFSKTFELVKKRVVLRKMYATMHLTRA